MLLTPHPLPPATAALLAVLDAWATRGWLRPLDAAFARYLAGEAPDAAPPLLLAAALASHQLGRGHACLALDEVLRAPLHALSLPPDEAPDPDAAPTSTPAELLAPLTLAAWKAALQHPQLVAPGAGATPLVLQGARLYLRRYWQHEQGVRRALATRLAGLPGLDHAASRPWLDALFPPPQAPEAAPATDWQKIACAVAARSGFGLITGGPGTGKTTTVVRLLALLQTQALHGGAAPGQPLRIRLAAPTGKAAARLNSAIAAAVATLPLAQLPGGDALRAHIPTQVVTLHRLLGPRPDSRHFRHHAGHPLPLDVLVVDEASMVDLELMHAVLDALPPEARLVLLGDKDQLASVEAGAVLGQLCAHAAAGRYRPDTAAWIAAATGQAVPPELTDPDGPALSQHTVMLRHSRRFAGDSGIGQLALAVNQGEADAGWALLASPRPDLRSLRAGPQRLEALRDLVVDGDPARGAAGYRHYLACLRDDRPPLDAPAAAFDAWAERVLATHGGFQVLCALRQGPWGVAGLNHRIAQWLHAAGWLDAPSGWYPGRPVLVTRNDHALGLMNGDIGIALTVPHPDPVVGGWTRRVAFPRADGQPGVRWVLPSRLTAVETVFALTVHKSQGSEFAHAALVLPDHPSPVLTRELVYTGLTRAKTCLSVVHTGPRSVWDAAVQRRTLRAGGLAEGV
ncbi:exodeoxyribonuclease V subunit alpha [Aquabacterium sp. A08]|uniref:exodeoxyribonuclease V subunit alpha n=1 Tax=Aquabacterium sp. A08 TaxID=2718532 RepID=UPI00141F4CD7|nr:exodeoxyribonuclease V subunit alpha [Aquabacterium sp. A08]NIC41114.1 exodeoxyribonuclease V subunit alpha [Aquabacterium sp. A08]NIC41139.1 exodeoxyribonuclease V subunit alpha [Aquabacterium sp. A08]